MTGRAWSEVAVKGFILKSVITCGQKLHLSTVTVHRLLWSDEIFPSGCVMEYKTCIAPTHSSPCPFAPFVFASTSISLCALALSSEFSLSLPLSCSPSPHFTFSFYLLCASPFKFFFSKTPRDALFSWSTASRLPLLFISGFFCLSLPLSPTLTSLCEFCTEDSLVLFLKITPTARGFHVGFLVLGVGRICK